VLEEIKRFDEALVSFEQALTIEADSVDAFVGLADSALSACDWARTSKIASQLQARLTEGKLSVTPFMVLGYFDDPALQLKCAAGYWKAKIPAPLMPGRRSQTRSHPESADCISFGGFPQPRHRPFNGRAFRIA